MDKDLKYTLEYVPINTDMGNVLKQLRIASNISATQLKDFLHKSPSYITKLERGEIKRLDSQTFTDICNFITKSDDGVRKFIYKITENLDALSPEAELIVSNLDDLLVVHTVSDHLSSFLKHFLADSKITPQDVANKVNGNEDIRDRADYDDLPENIWVMNGNDPADTVIKFNISEQYITDLFAGKIQHVHRVIIEGILVAIFTLDDTDNPREAADNILITANIPRSYGNKHIAFGLDLLSMSLCKLDSAQATNIVTIAQSLATLSVLEPTYSKPRISHISQMLDSDLGYYIAYMNMDIHLLKDKPREIKQAFLQDVRLLVQRYAKKSGNVLEKYD